ncbi:MAG: ParB-like nuclease domain-containing protein, partial [Clostridia bacterium]|nr:ParB-like nuclease domain-containing protein [Clostridia bacterium]
EENIKYRVNAQWFEKRVQALKKALQSNNDMPPLIVHFVDHGFELCDGNHRFEALTRLGIKEYPVIIWITEKEEYDEFIDRYIRIKGL